MKLLYIYNLYQQAGGENQWVQSEPDLFRARGHEVVIYRRDNNEIGHFSLSKRVADDIEDNEGFDQWVVETHRQYSAALQEESKQSLAGLRYSTVERASPHEAVLP